MQWRALHVSLAALGGAAAGAALWRTRRRRQSACPVDAAAMHALLTRAAPMLRLPTSPDQPPMVLADGTGLRCPATGRAYRVRDGILDLLATAPVLTDTQRMLDTRFTAWAYDRGRDAFMRVAGAPSFADEVAQIAATLAVAPGATLLDLACGQGNFSVALAEHIGSDGLVIGLDLSPAMLVRAARRVRDAGLTNVLLIRGDAQQLPFADATLGAINCSGGFHQLPDLPRALAELARVSTADGALTASTFATGPEDRYQGLKRALTRRYALHFVPLDGLEAQVAAVGYRTVHAMLVGGWFAYLAARKAPARPAPMDVPGHAAWPTM